MATVATPSGCTEIPQDWCTFATAIPRAWQTSSSSTAIRDVILAGEGFEGPGGEIDTVGIFREGTFDLRYSNTAGNADEEFGCDSSLLPVAGSFGPLPGGDDPPADEPILVTGPVYAIGDSVMKGAISPNV